MIFTKQQVEEILRIIDYHYSFVIATNLGIDSLTEDDKTILQSFGIDLKDFENLFPPFYQMYYLGKLSSVLSNKQLNLIEYNDYKKHFESGKYFPLTKTEKFQLDIAKRKSYSHLKGLANKSKAYMSDIVLDHERKLREKYEEVIHDEIERGVLDRKAIGSVISEIGHKMEDWQRDWGRIVETEMNNIYQEGKAQSIVDKYGEDAQVYKDVYPKACRHCISLYLTGGIGSQPKLFTIEELINNGDNLNKKVADWKAVVGSTHPFCRCDLRRLPKGYKWNEETQRFELDKGSVEDLSYKGKVKISFGNKTFMINQ